MARKRPSKAKREALRRDLRVCTIGSDDSTSNDSLLNKADVTKIKASSTEALSLFREGVKLYTNVSLETFSQITTEEDVLRYLFRLYR